MTPAERRRISVEGVVQGVGFRPRVHALATRHGLAGFVRNEAGRVIVEVEGGAGAIEAFLQHLSSNPPPLARIDRVESRRVRTHGTSGFVITRSGHGDIPRPVLPPDVATCDACLTEVWDPSDRRHRYAFTVCTQCGPRYTVVRALPYDRERTTMAGFRLCEACRREYEDPTDRRFHAEPLACPACGPRLRLTDPAGRPVEGASGADPLSAAASLLVEGGILAVRGLGGYHLACDATSESSVRTLRGRKGREAKPLAVMVRDLETARTLAFLDGPAADALAAPSRPIVLVARRPETPLAPTVAPDLDEVGLMLPYTPLHHLLLDAVPWPLVMTSGNRSGEPIVTHEAEALERLAGVADGFLTHDRPIAVRCDDSVLRPMDGGVTVLRRSRGFVPAAIRLPVASPTTLLAVGGHLKNTFCLVRGDQATPSHHVGDLDGRASFRAFRGDVALLEGLLGLRPKVLVHDLHPAYLSTRYARERAEAEGLETMGVQHHHAHVASLLTEHGQTGPVIGVAFDGTGHGDDGAVWGGEFLVADLESYERAGHLGYVPLPGGEAAVREPWRMAAAHLTAAGIDPVTVPGLLEGRRAEAWPLVEQAIRRGVASPPTSSVGRLFDAASALLGLRHRSRFEGEAAMILEAAADPAVRESGPVELAEGGASWTWDGAWILRWLLEARREGRKTEWLAAAFHETVARTVVEGCRRVRDGGGPPIVGLTGGVFQNALLLARVHEGLESEGFRVLLPRRVPPNDGGLALGQAAVAAARRTRSRGRDGAGGRATPRPRAAAS